MEAQPQGQQGQVQQGQQGQAQAQAPAPAQERLNHAVQQQLNLEQVKTRALSLFKAISRILEDFDAYGRTNSTPKWQDILGQYSMVNLELFNIVDEMKKVSKAFVVHPKNVNAENATSILSFFLCISQMNLNSFFTAIPMFSFSTACHAFLKTTP